MGLCFSFLMRFLLSCRRAGGGGPRTSLARDLTAEDATNLRIFFFFGKYQLTTEVTEMPRENRECFGLSSK